MSNHSRAPRVQESREAEVIHEAYEDSWEPASLLDTKNIPARPGYVQRWVRTSLRGVDDQSNVFAKFSRRWQPRPASSIPKGLYVPTVKFQDADIVGHNGMILMERPIEIHEKQAAFNRQQARDLVQAEKSNLYKVHDAASRKYITRPEYKSSENTTTGRVPDIDD